MNPNVIDSPASQRLRASPLTWGSLLVVCGIFSALRWLKWDRLWGDSDRWMFEVYRTANGEMPYLDFAWQYPPLAIFLGAALLSILGLNFTSLQLFVSLLSTLVVLLTWDTSRRYLPEPLPWAVGLLTACAGVSNNGNFALFSLQIYTPALLTGIAGLLLLIRAAADYLQTGVWTSRGIFWMVTGTTIALLSKPEFIVGALGCLGVTALAGRRNWQANGKVLALSLLPAMAIYLAIAYITGPGNLAAGIGGYGIALLTCPWWPTGLGLFGGLAALCYGIILAALFSLLRLRPTTGPYRRRRLLLWAAAAVSALLLSIYLPFAIRESPVLRAGVSPARLVSFFLSLGNMMLPVMWIGMLAWVIGVIHAVRLGWGEWHTTAALWALLLTPAALISLRGLFGGTMSQLTSVSPAAYPIWFIFAPYLLLRFYHHLEPAFLAAASQTRLVTAITVGYASIRLAGALGSHFVTPYTTIVSPAGTIRVEDGEISPRVLSYVAANTRTGEPVLDVANGGGINFAAHRPSPLFSTQFTALAPAEKYMQDDLERIRRHPPRLVIANAGADFQASYGLCLSTGCTCPAFVWRSARLACDPGRKFPVLEYIRANYEPKVRFGDKIIYEQKELALVP